MVEKREFTTREAAALTDVPQNRIQKFIDTGPIPRRLSRTGRRSARVLFRCDVAFVWILVRGLPEIDLGPELKGVLYREIAGMCAAGESETDEVRLTPFLSIRRVKELFLELGGRIERLERARGMVESDPQIKGGEPVFKGTRIPVHLVAAILEQGASPEELRKSYPSLDDEMIALARVYAQANPKTGRPARHPWR